MHDRYEPLEGDILIIDECSMIDIQLMFHLLNAIPEGMKLLLVGDIDQLPSVGPGNVLRDIISSEKFTTIRLQKIFRQAQESMIVTNAHRINKGEMPLLKSGEKTDFFFANIEDPKKAAEYIVSLVKEKLPKVYNIRSEDIQVLSPMRKGELGTIYLNNELQKAVNPTGIEIPHGGTALRVNDKVMQIVNNYEKDVFNGDVGTIVSIDQEENTFSVNFDGKLVAYKKNEMEELIHAYATTIHKSQGSEYPIVIMPVTMGHFIMLQRNLIYTGLTRAKKVIVMVGTKKALSYAVQNVETYRRNTYLKERLIKES